MGTEASATAPRVDPGVAPRHDGPLQGGPPLQPGPLEDLLATVQQRSTKKQVSAFVAQPGGLLGLGVAGQDAKGVLVLEVRVESVDIPEYVADAVDTIRYFLDNQLNAERDRMRRLLA